MKADLICRKWRRVDVKLALEDNLHVIRWRRGVFADEVLFDGRKVAESRGLFGRETIFGLEMKTDNEKVVRMLLTIDPSTDSLDMNGDMRPDGVRLETADDVLLAIGSLAPGTGDRAKAAFSDLFDRASKALGLS
ncbi:MAG: hypothetical protein AAF668_14470 [Pseudomonadota bacterium]